jgi:UDP-N-acetylmuramate dehydrogenase
LRSGERTFDPELNVVLAPLTTLGIGGAARWFARARAVEDVAAAHRWACERGVELFVLGGGSNLVIADGGFDGLVMQIDVRGVDFTRDGDDTLVRAGAGEPWDGVVAAAVSRGLAGVECLSGIPGSVGGTPVQNVGAYGQEVGDTIDHVIAFDRRSESLVTLTNAECQFGYRMSRFKREDAGRFVVCEVRFRLRPGQPTTTYPDVTRHFDRHGIPVPTIADARVAVLEVRRNKGMVIDPADPDSRSVGSFFMNPVVPRHVHGRVAAESGDRQAPGFPLAGGNVKIPAAWLIEQGGFAKGYNAGRVGLSTKHPLAIVNRGGATARDVLALAVRIKRQVLDRFGIGLHPEPVFVGLANDPDVEYLANVDTAD